MKQKQFKHNLSKTKRLNKHKRYLLEKKFIETFNPLNISNLKQ